MIKGLTALTVFINFIDDYGRMPEKDEFVALGYCTRTYYRTKNTYKDYLKARIEEKEDGGSPRATLNDDIAEGFIRGLY